MDDFAQGFISINSSGTRIEQPAHFLRWLRAYIKATMAKVQGGRVFSVGALRLLLDYALQNGIDADLETLNKLYYSLLVPLAKAGYIQLRVFSNDKPSDLLYAVVNVDVGVIGYG